MDTNLDHKLSHTRMLSVMVTVILTVMVTVTMTVPITDTITVIITMYSHSTIVTMDENTNAPELAADRPLTVKRVPYAA